MAVKMKLIRQEATNECAIACVSMIEHFYGFKQPLSYYRNRLRIGRDGASLKDIYFLLTKDNFSVQLIKIENFEEFIFDSGPYIIHLEKAHFIVVEKSKKNTLRIYDPSKGISLISRTELQSISTGYCIYAVPDSNFVRTDNVKSDFRHMIPTIKKLGTLISSIFAISLFAYAFTLFLPLLLQYYVNEAFYNFSFNLVQILLQLCLLIGIFWVISTLRNKALVQLQLQLYKNISFSTIEHLFKVNYSYFDNRSEGDVLFRLQFLTQFQNAISGTFLQLIMSITSMIMVLIYFGFKYLFFLLVLLPTLIIFFALVMVMNNHLLELKKNELQASSQIEQTITEIVNNMLQIRCLHLEKNFWNSYKSTFELFMKHFKVSQNLTQRYSLIINIMFTFMPPMFVIIMMSVYSAGLDVGAIFAIYSLLTTLFTQCMNLVTNISSIQMLKASIVFLNDFLDEPESASNENCLINSFSTLEAKNLSFRYSDTGKNIINNMDFVIRRGENIAIIGASGSGKTTLVKLIAGLYPPSTGSLLFNGVPIHQVGREIYGKIISIVPQIPVVFNKTIRENIALDLPEISDEEIIIALKTACLWGEISAMPQGLDTIISGQGGNLSGGQIQRLSLARSLLYRPQMIVLDEATSSLDSKNENEIYKNLKETGITSLIITHRLSTVENADMVLFIDKGEIVGAGKHKYLLENCRPYVELYQAQTTSKGVK